MSTPLISVVMPVYNSEKYVAEAVESILLQTFSDFEFLIINEYGSNDRTLEIIEAYNDPRIRIIQNARKLGIAESLNVGIRQSQGKYIARMDGDDISLPERFKRQVMFMEENPDIAICGTWCEMFGDKPGFNMPQTDKEHIKACMLFNVEVVHSSVIFRASAIRAHGLYYDSGYLPEDFELFSRAVFNIGMANIPEVLLRYRTSEDNNTLNKADEIIDHSRRIVQRNIRRLGVEVPAALVPLLHSLKSHLRKREDLDKLTELFKEILLANKTSRLFKQDALEYVLRRHLLMLLNPFFISAFPEEIRDIITKNAFEMSAESEVCLFGTGKAFMDLAPYFIERLGDRITCVSDNNPSKWGESFLGLHCLPPDELIYNDKPPGFVVLANYDNMNSIVDGLKGKKAVNVRPYFDIAFGN